MWCFRQSNNIFIICSLLLLAGFMLQLKVLYNNHQKHIRMQQYQHTITEVEDQMTVASRVANETNFMLNRLKRNIKHLRFKYKLKPR